MPQKRSVRKKPLLSLFLVLIIGVYCCYALVRPIAPIHPMAANLHLQSGTISNQLVWPSQGQAALGINPSGVLATNGVQTAVPIASTAKVLTALCVLHKKPLAAHQMGPNITLNDADVALYSNYVAENGSVTPVQSGEVLSEYQMLQAILLPSANNVADSLAIWAFGSLDNYAAYANNYVRQLGLTHTHVGTDASGYSASTVSTAHDLVLIGEAAMQEPALADIVGQTSADLPVAGTVKNVNALIGVNNIVGVKTGNTDEAGGVFLAAKQATISGHKLVIVSAVVGTRTLGEALVGSLPLLSSAEKNFATTEILPTKAIVGRYPLRWAPSTSAVIPSPLTALMWRGASVPTEVRLQPVSLGSRAGTVVGQVHIPQSPVGPAQTVPVILASDIRGPSTTWRLLHPRD